MSDLIDRQALKNKICDCCEGKDEWCNGPCFEIMIIDSMPAITASPWHRAELEEPTKAGWYLVMDVDGDFNVDEWHNTFGWQFVTPSDADRITHWMPIEPPKEDE